MNTCSIDNCDETTIGRGWCNKHYRRWQRHGDPEGGRPYYRRPVVKCSGCGEMKRTHVKGACSKCYQRKWYRYIKAEALEVYGGKCAHCGEDDKAVLVIDHVDGGGNKHRTKVGGGSNFNRWLRRKNWPEGFQVLCANCNMRKGA